MDLETAQRIERLEYQVAMLYRHLGLNPDAGLLPPPAGVLPLPPQDAVPAGQDPRLPHEFYDMIARGKKIQAIKIYREVYRVGLKEAKDFVDAYEREHGRR
jgi:hypothetical protein